jgi:aldehyde dehydrogenase (NAD+)
MVMKAAASSNLKNITLELGGKSPNIVFADADIDQAVKWACFGIFLNHGQCCCAGSRVFVEESIYEEFREKFLAQSAKHKVGDPFAADTFQGPQISQIQYDRIMSYIEQGKAEGATCEMGGNRLGDKGYFIEPTVFSNVKPNMKIVQEEIFGPVVVLVKFKDEADVIAQANDTEYGLASAVFTKDIAKATRVSQKLHAGTVWINCYNQLHPNVPFGGFKSSGIGRGESFGTASFIFPGNPDVLRYATPRVLQSSVNMLLQTTPRSNLSTSSESLPVHRLPSSPTGYLIQNPFSRSIDAQCPL